MRWMRWAVEDEVLAGDSWRQLEMVMSSAELPIGCSGQQLITAVLIPQNFHSRLIRYVIFS